MAKENFITACVDKNNDKEIEFNFVQYNLDNIDMTLPDALIGLDKLYPMNSRTRNELESGDRIISILLESRDLYPIKGIICIVMKDPQKMSEIESKDYIVISTNVLNLRSRATIDRLCLTISRELYKFYGDSEKRFGSIFRKFINLEFDKNTMNPAQSLEDVMQGDYVSLVKK